MASYGTPDNATRRCGEEIARLRVKRGMSRSRFILRLYDALQPDDPYHDSIGEPWLRRLENGHLVKLPRQTLEAICEALECTDAEYHRLMLLADRNVLVQHDSEPNTLDEVINSMIAVVHEEAEATLSGIIGTRQARDLTEDERQYLIATALELALRKYRR